MTTYTTIPNTQIEPEAPVTSELMTLLRDNPLAIQEGDSTAPRILSPALDLTYKTGTASRSSSGTSTVVSLTTTDLSNLADMTLALVTGWINVLPSNEQTCSGEISVTNDGTILSFSAFDDANEEKRSFAYLIVLSSDTSVTISMTHSGSGTVSAAGQILILGR